MSTNKNLSALANYISNMDEIELEKGCMNFNTMHYSKDIYFEKISHPCIQIVQYPYVMQYN